VYRGVPLALRDPFMRKAISALSGVVDVVAVTSAWERALGVPAWSGPPTWIHGDLDRRNVLVEDGRLTAVIDWGCMAVGDPAYDAIAGWSLFAGESREAFRVALEVDDATWERTRGLVLSGGVFGLVTFHPDGTVEGVPYYEETNPVIVDASRRALQDALGDDE
jgi:aminoglycoside phosphotransferase (APT) family kinase protein